MPSLAYPMLKTHICPTPDDTFALGRQFGETLSAGDAVLLSGGLGAGKTLFAKGLLSAFDFDTDEVTSPSFTLVNLYKTAKQDVYHIDLWRLDEVSDIAFAVGLEEIIEAENSITVIEWAERLKAFPSSKRVFRIEIEGDGDESRTITIKSD